MNDYAFFLDATADLTPQIIEEMDLSVFPMDITVDGKNYLHYPDAREIGFHDFYEHLRAGKPASTAQITVNTFLNTFEPLLKEGKDILYVAFSSGLSGTCNSAMLAARELEEQYPERKVYVVDSLSASMGEGLLIYLAAQLRRDGKTIDEVKDWLEKNRLRLCHWFTVDDLQHLRRGGRVSGASAFVGTVLSIKPVLHVDDAGHLIPVSKTRGRKNSLKELVSHMEETCESPEEQVIFISHGDALEDAEYVASMVREKFPVKDIKIGFIGPIVGCHSGPGTVALFFLGSQR